VSELAPAKCRIEILRGPPVFFDDHWLKGWTVVQGSQGFDGDTTTITVGASQASAYIWRALEFDSAVYKYWLIRCTNVAATSWLIRVRRKDTQAWVTVAEYTTTGLKEADISAVYSGVVDRILIEVVGSPGQNCEFDYMGICKNTVLTPVLSGDVVDEHTITRPIFNVGGVMGAKLTITNFNAENTDKIKAHDVIIIWLTRDSVNLGVPAYKVFGGRIVNPTNRAEGYGRHFIDLDCHGHAYETINPPGLLQKLYSPATNGRILIEDALALCSYVAKHPTASKWFDNAGASGSTDDRINSTHDVEYDEVVPKTVIDEICDKASNPEGAKGFDIVEMPSGVLMGHLRNSLDFVSPIASITPETYSKSEDVHRVKNKNIKIYGEPGQIGDNKGKADKGRKEPSDGDLWTLDNINNWVAEKGSISAQTSVPKVGTNYIRGDAALEAGTYKSQFRRDLGTLVKGFGKGAYQTVNLYVRSYLNPMTTRRIRLYAPDANNYFYASLPAGDQSQWVFYQFQLGEQFEYDVEKNPDGAWNKVGSPVWGALSSIAFYGDATVNFGFCVDGLYFGHGRWRASAEDSTSQQNYGGRVPEPIIDDNLKSDAECQAMANAYRDFLKDPITSLQNVLVDGDYRYTPGDRQRIIVSNDNLDAYYRIIQVVHKVVGVSWDTILTKSDEPQFVAPIFPTSIGGIVHIIKKVKEDQKRLNRRRE